MTSVYQAQRPVASARGIMVFCVPFLASTGQAKPTQCWQLNAGRAVVVGFRVDQQRHGQALPAQRLQAAPADFALCGSGSGGMG